MLAVSSCVGKISFFSHYVFVISWQNLSVSNISDFGALAFASKHSQPEAFGALLMSSNQRHAKSKIFKMKVEMQHLFE